MEIKEIKSSNFQSDFLMEFNDRKKMCIDFGGDIRQSLELHRKKDVALLDEQMILSHAIFISTKP